MDKFFAKKAFRSLSKIYQVSFNKKQNFHYFEKQATAKNFMSYKFLFLMPKADLETIVNHPCHLNQDKIPKGQFSKVVTSHKKIRMVLGIEEEKVCKKCPISEKCHLKDKVPAKRLGSSKDIALILYSMASSVDLNDTSKELTENEFLTYLAAVKVLDSFKGLMEEERFFEDSENSRHEVECSLKELVEVNEEQTQLQFKLKTVKSFFNMLEEKKGNLRVGGEPR